ncbi:TetR/AcrR family transcriptional regulator [Microbacterium lacticum]
MVDAAAILLARQGYQATSFSTVLEASGAPRGSIYHHFPDGKDQLIAAALERQTTRVVDELAHLKGLTPVEIVDGFSRNWRAMLLATDYALGCSLLAVTTSAGPGELRNGAGVAFERWITAISELLEEAGVDRTAARSFATLTLTSVEGAVAVSRACHSIEPLDAVVDELRRGASGLGRDSREHSESRD